jgi:hypothetical protein
LQIAIAGERSAADDPIQSVLGELRAGEYRGGGEKRRSQVDRMGCC